MKYILIALVALLVVSCAPSPSRVGHSHPHTSEAFSELDCIHRLRANSYKARLYLFQQRIKKDSLQQH